MFRSPADRIILVEISQDLSGSNDDAMGGPLSPKP